MKKERKRYDQSFKDEIVNKFLSGTKVSELVKEHNLSDGLIYHWIKGRKAAKTSLVVSPSQELALLKDQNEKQAAYIRDLETRLGHEEGVGSTMQTIIMALGEKIKNG